MKSLELEGGKALAVVAHPDDETIWLGGAILKFKNLKWTIMALCRKDDRERAPKFKQACRLYGARPLISDLEDEGLMNLKESLPEIEKRIKRELSAKRFDFLFTHGYNGEYWHPRHRGVHRAVKRLLAGGELKAKRVFHFAYCLDEAAGIAVSDSRAAWGVPLSKDFFRAKRDIIENLYGFKKDSFEYRSCSHLETFNEIVNSLRLSS